MRKSTIRIIQILFLTNLVTIMLFHDGINSGDAVWLLATGLCVVLAFVLFIDNRPHALILKWAPLMKEMGFIPAGHVRIKNEIDDAYIFWKDKSTETGILLKRDYSVDTVAFLNPPAVVNVMIEKIQMTKCEFYEIFFVERGRICIGDIDVICWAYRGENAEVLYQLLMQNRYYAVRQPAPFPALQ
jgi:hypothetical protein